MHSTLTGIGVSAGTATGPLVRLSAAPGPLANEATDDVRAASVRIREALTQVAAGLAARAAIADEHARPILEASVMMTEDPGLAAAIDAHLESKGPTNAVAAAIEDYCALLESMGGYMAERVTDLRDVGARTIARLLGLPEPGVPDLHEPSVLTAVDLAPAETATLDRAMVLGIVIEEGGPTSHTAILAAQLGIPAVVRAVGISEVDAGTLVALDGGTGEVFVDPDEAKLAELTARRERREAALRGSGPGLTADGRPVALLANIGTVADAESAASADVEGVGLFRTEFMFLGREVAPCLAEQTEAYTAVLRAFGTRRVVVRTLDAGADKPLAFADLGPEENPALGQRGIRLNRVREDLLDDQLAALAAADAATEAELWVMAPMISTVAETRWFVERARAAGLRQVGVMIEVPAAALRATDILGVADFASLGTNDLGQYTMAADRTQGALADLLDPWQPALLDVIAAACEGGAATGKKVGVCGEAGGDPALALVLVGFGVTSLSMAPGKVAAVRTALAAHSLAECQRLADIAREAASPEEARQAVLAAANPVLGDLV